jgi:hypothetical protein
MSRLSRAAIARRMIGWSASRWLGLGFATTVLLVASAAIAVASSGGDGGRVRACVDRGTGVIRLSGARSCPRGSFMVAWDKAAPTGPSGVGGAPGAIGPAGPAGSAGRVGPTGGEGAKGATGATGAAGEVGATGPPGAIGPTGPAGASGPAGAAGPAGPSGAQGPAGSTGPVGPAGPIGAAGPSGPNTLPGLEMVHNSKVFISSSGGNSEYVTATCPAGKQVSAGGAHSTLPYAIITASDANGSSAWQAEYRVLPGFAPSGTPIVITAFAYCSE